MAPVKIFMTGATGFVGRAVAGELVGAGHEVTAIARSVEKARVALGPGVEIHPGDLLDGASYRGLASAADVVVHIGFDYSDPINADRTVLETLLAATDGRETRFIYTSGAWVVGDTRGAEWGDDAPTNNPADLVAWRVQHEQSALEARSEPRSTAVIRPGVVYGGKRGATERMFATARRNGAADFVGDGSNHWSLIYIGDLARLYRVVIEHTDSGVFQAVDGRPLTVSEVAAAASRAAGADGDTRAVPAAVAREKIGAVADALCLDQKLTAPAARAAGWVPRHASFIEGAATAFADWQRETA